MRLMGMPISAITRDQAVERVFEALSAGRGGRVLTSNIDVLRQYSSSAEVRERFDETELVVTDGVPVVWALSLQGTPVPERITGTDMLMELSAESAVRGKSVLLAGGRPGEAERAAARLSELNPGLIADSHPCYVDPASAPEEFAKLSRLVLERRRDIVFLGVPFAYQLAFMSKLRECAPNTWFVGIGSSFEFLNGVRRRAPEWLQRIGLEWAFRLTQQPRLWRRYLLHGLPFAAHLGLHVTAVRVRRIRGSAYST